MLGDEVAGAPECRAVNPLRLEAKCIELRAEHVANLAYPSEVHRAAVYVHDPFEERQRFGVVSIDGAHDRALARRERRLRLYRVGDDEGRDRGDNESETAWTCTHGREFIAHPS